LSYAVLLITQDYWLFLIAVLTDISPDEETKRKNFGLMGAFFGLGFIVGPVIGSVLLKFGSVTNIFWFGTIFALIEFVLILTHFSNTNHLQPEKKLTYNSLHIMRKYLKKPTMRNILVSLAML